MIMVETAKTEGLIPPPKGYYDRELGMFCDGPKDLDVGALRFWRHLAENRLLYDGEVLGEPAGPYKPFSDLSLPAPIMNRKIRSRVSGSS